MAATEAFRIGDAIAAQALAQAFGFADIDDVVLGIAHFVNAGMTGKFAEKLFAKPLD